MLRPRPARTRVRQSVSAVLTALLFLVILPAGPPASRVAARAAAGGNTQNPAIPTPMPGSAYRVTHLISDIPGFAPVLDRLLVNPWGLTFRNTSPFWVANNRSSTTQLITGDVGGAPVRLNANPQTITIPGGLPTGAVGNTTSDFQITPPGGGTPAPANFIFDSLTGKITAWNGASGSSAQQVVDMSGGAHVWTGLAIGQATGGNRLYAANFAAPVPNPIPTPTPPVQVDVFDGTFNPTTVPGGFIDATIPAGFAAFNIQNLGGSLYVTYAKVGTPSDPVANGPGLGFVRKFSTDGVRQLGFAINGGVLDAPWGLAIAPASFGAFSNKLLVGNFSDDGFISAYDPATGAPFVPTGLPDNRLRDESGNPITIDELWALQFGNGGSGGDVNTLYFSAGTSEEEHGLFGKINPTSATATSLIQFASDTFAFGEGGGHIDITVTRAGDVTGTATVNYNTFDESRAGHASQKSDYEISLGKLTFNPGETSKTFRILLVDDNFVEGDETIDLALSNPTGAGVGLGSPNRAEVTILDNDSAASTSNPIDNSSFFVRQHYLDFLNREPDASGLQFWIDNIESCGADAACRELKRINTSAAFFLSIEFQRTGLLAYLANEAAFGPKATTADANVPVLYGQFERDVQQLQQNLVFGQPGFDAQLEANKTAYFNDFVARPEFVAAHGSQTDAQYVDSLLGNAGMGISDFTVNLTNDQEVPPTNPTTSGGARRPRSYGRARFQINSTDTAMTMTTTVHNIDVTGSQTPDANDNLQNAHIHAGPSVMPGVNGPVVWGFFGSPINDNNPDDRTVTPFPIAPLNFLAVGGVFTGKWDAPEGNGTTLTAQLPNIRAGHAYINFHTTQFPGGEIRGIFPATQAFRDSLVNGLTGGTLTRAQVLRQIAESQTFAQLEFNRAFVTMEYFGYLRRDPDSAGFEFWLDKLNSFGGNFVDAEMVKAFISSSEYRQRFGAS